MANSDTTCPILNTMMTAVRYLPGTNSVRYTYDMAVQEIVVAPISEREMISCRALVTKLDAIDIPVGIQSERRRTFLRPKRSDAIPPMKIPALPPIWKIELATAATGALSHTRSNSVTMEYFFDVP